MGQKRYTPEQIIGKLRQAEVRSAEGARVAEIVRELGITEQTYYRWRKEYGGLKVSQAKRLKELEQENARLKRAVADLTLDKLILEEAAKGKLLSPERRRRCVMHVVKKFGASERRACRVLGQVRSTQRRQARKRPDEEALRTDVVKLASRYGRYGYRRVTALLRAEGWVVNHKRVERIWRQEGLRVPKKQPKRGRLWLNDGSCVRLRPTHRGHVWSYDFTMARTHDGRPLRMLTVLDEHTRECLAIVVERKLKSDDVLHTLAGLFAKHGAPEHLRSDNGPEFTSQVVRAWLGRVGVRTLFIEPGSPWENGYNESFNGKLKDELVDREIFYSLREAQVLVEQWRREYNTIRPHSSLGYRPPAPQAVRPVGSWLRRPMLQGPRLAVGLT
ncbi:MAG: IS3 family transposase [marine benthic group bacterium]|nr:IS3 family transposase [Gemmatimonadota bacterium]